MTKQIREILRSVKRRVHNFRTYLYKSFINIKYGRKVFDVDNSSFIYGSAKILPLAPSLRSIKVGGNTVVRGELMTFGHGGGIDIGEYCIVGKNSCIWSALRISIGNRVLISHNVNIFDSLTHPFSAELRHEQFKAILTTGHPRHLDLEEREIAIGDDVLICAGSIVLRGVTIGEGAVVGAGSVVTKDVAPWTVVAGNPARVIRTLNPTAPRVVPT